MESESENRIVISKVVLNPQIAWIGKTIPTPLEVDRLHQLAREECFIANSIRNRVIIALYSNPLRYPTGRDVTSEEISHVSARISASA